LSHSEDAPSSVSKLPSGIEGLDAMIGGGLPEGKIVLVLGEPGTGKTILCSQFLHWGATERNENASWGETGYFDF
jgi:circadian clock protein KaiC